MQKIQPKWKQADHNGEEAELVIMGDEILVRGAQMRPGTESFLEQLTKIPGISKVWLHVCQPRYLPFTVPMNIQVT